MSCSGSAPLERSSTDSGSCIAFIVMYTVHQDKASDVFGAKYCQSWMDVVLAILWGFVICSCEQELVLSVAVSLHVTLLYFSRPELSFLLYLPRPFQHLCRIDVSCDSHFLVPLITYNPINSCLNYNPRHSILAPWSTFEHAWLVELWEDCEHSWLKNIMESWCDQTVCNCAHSKIMERDLSDEQTWNCMMKLSCRNNFQSRT